MPADKAYWQAIDSSATYPPKILTRSQGVGWDFRRTDLQAANWVRTWFAGVLVPSVPHSPSSPRTARYARLITGYHNLYENM